MHVIPDTPASTTDDAALIASSLADPACFGEIYDRHHAAVFRYVRSRIGLLADDVVGDTFLEAFRIRERFDAARGSSARPWLLGIATNMVDRRRDLERRWLRDHSSPQEPAHASDDDLDSRIDDQRLTPAVHEALASLRRRDRVALLLHVTGDLTVEEVAAALDIPPGTVKSRLHRARRILAARLEVHR